MSTNSNNQVISPEVKFGKIINALKAIASHDTSRRNLAGICFEKGRAIATNGHIACIIAAQDKGDFEGQVVVDAKDLPTIKPKHELVLLPPESKKQAQFHITNCKPGNFQSFTVDQVDADFPNVDNCFPNTDNDPVKFEIVLDGSYLQKLLAVHEQSGLKGVRFTFHDYGNVKHQGPVKLTSGYKNGDTIVTSLIMPLDD